MPDFALIPGPTTAPVMGMIARGALREALLRKIAERKAHYERLSLASGDGWVALVALDGAAPPDLPWLTGEPVFLYALGQGCFCQVGYRPNVPEILHDKMVAALRRNHDLGAAMALTAERPEGQVYGLAKACAVGAADLAALRAGS